MRCIPTSNSLKLLLGIILFYTSTFAQKKIRLFDGKTLKNWTPKLYHHEVGDNYQNTFRVHKGTIQVRYDGYESFGDRYGHLFYKSPFSHYKLSLEYKFTGKWMPDAPWYTELNSGVMFHSQSPQSILKEQDWPISVEFQFLAEKSPQIPRTTGNMCSPGTHIFYNGVKDTRHCIDSKSKSYPPDRWIKAELIVLGDSLITHIIEGDTVMQYSKPHTGGDMANGTNPCLSFPDTPLYQGYIGLQSEGQEIDFRNIYLIDLRKRKKVKSKK
ncbi:MAG: 3-keto-disaccharide hydrolase [Leadbetterella sp.]